MTSRPVVIHSHAPHSALPLIHSRVRPQRKSSHMLLQKHKNTPYMLCLFHPLTFIHKQVKEGGGKKFVVELTEVKIYATASCQHSSLLGADHLRDKVDNGVCRLFRVQLSEEVADIVGCASLLTRHKPKQPERSKIIVMI